MTKKLRIFWRQASSKQHILGTLIIIAIALCVATPLISFMPESAQAYETQASTDYLYSKEITIAHSYIGTALTNFPVRVRDNTGDLSGILSNGSDIAFYAVGNSTQYNHEIEEYNSTTGELIAWVNVTSISSSADTLFYMYYNDADGVYPIGHNPTSVWDVNYLVVYHFDESTGICYDSTANDYDGTVMGAPVYDKVSTNGGKAVYFDGTDDAFNFTDAALKIDTDITYEVYANCSSTDYGRLFWMGEVGHAEGSPNYVMTVGLSLSYYYATAVADYGGTAAKSLLLNDTAQTVNTWYHMTMRIDQGVSYQGFTDGILQSHNFTGFTFGLSPAQDFRCYIANSKWGFGAATMGEVRISNIARSTDWISASFDTNNGTTGFSTLGSQQGGAATSTYTLVGLPNNRITWAGTAGNSVYCNSTGDNNEVLEINMSVNTTDNVTEIRVWVGDLNNTGTTEYVNASNITLYISSDNSSWGSMGSFSDGGSNTSINTSTWPAGGGANPFAGAGLININASIFCIFKVAIPAGASTDIFWSFSSTDWKIYIGHYT